MEATSCLIWKQLRTSFLEIVAQDLLFFFQFPQICPNFVFLPVFVLFSLDTEINPSFSLPPSHDANHPLVSGWTPRGCSIFSNIKVLPLSNTVFILIGLQLLSAHLLQPSSTSCVTASLLSVSSHALLSHPSFFFLSQRLRLSLPAVSPQLCPLSSHQYPSASPPSKE